MSKHVGLTKHTTAAGVTYTNMYDGSTQFIPKDEFDRRMKLTDKQNEQEIEGKDQHHRKDKKK